MAFSEKELKTFMENELGPEDTFNFACKMCGDCCRNRSEPIMVTGADIYRIASALNMTTEKFITEYTDVYIGITSHTPVVVLKERMDGSCKLLRKGRCTVQKAKPAVCALFPLGRFYDSRDGKFHYFFNQKSCQPGSKDGKVWTLQEWLDNFSIRETEDMTKSWNRLVSGIAKITHRMKPDELKGGLLEVLLTAMYFGYNTDVPFIEQVEKHMSALKAFFKYRLHKTIVFD